MSRDDDLIIEKNEKGGLRCPECGSPKWVREGSSFTFVLKGYRCLECDACWLMFKKDIEQSVEEFNK